MCLEKKIYINNKHNNKEQQHSQHYYFYFLFESNENGSACVTQVYITSQANLSVLALKSQSTWPGLSSVNSKQNYLRFMNIDRTVIRSLRMEIHSTSSTF